MCIAFGRPKCYLSCTKRSVTSAKSSGYLTSLTENEYEYILTGGGKMVGVFADGWQVALLKRTS